MTKSEWTANYQAARVIHSGLVKMMMVNRRGCGKAIETVWKAIDELGMRDVMFGSKLRPAHDIRVHKWAVKTNSQTNRIA